MRPDASNEAINDLRSLSKWPSSMNAILGRTLIQPNEVPLPFQGRHPLFELVQFFDFGHWSTPRQYPAGTTHIQQSDILLSIQADHERKESYRRGESKSDYTIVRLQVHPILSHAVFAYFLIFLRRNLMAIARWSEKYFSKKRCGDAAK